MHENTHEWPGSYKHPKVTGILLYNKLHLETARCLIIVTLSQQLVVLKIRCYRQAFGGNGQGK
jgi:hypothetical protein